MKPGIGNRFITLSRTDERFAAYLDGTFSEVERALPVDSFHVGTPDEKVTFRIVGTNETQTPSRAGVWWRSLRPLLLPLTLGPVTTILVYALAMGWAVDWWLGLSSLLAVCCWHGTAFLLNDYSDHLTGVDRLSRFGGSQVIQLGWATAHQVKLWAFWLFALGLVLGIPALLARTWTMLFIGATATLLVLTFSYAGRGLKSWGLGNLPVFLGMGPLLTAGFSLAVAGRVNSSVLIVGSLFGIGASLCIQLRNMENLLAHAQAKTGTLVSRLGFDRSKWFVTAQLLIFVVILALFVGWQANRPLQVLVFLPLLGSVYRIFRRLREVRSPLSSELIGLWQEGLTFHLLMGLGLNLLLFLVWQAGR
ncbi:MAG: prenyltransferase [Bdellovibrionales bacterium]|nr:prenyltransferase [Bdellovibrionales bacterium]